MNQTSALSCAVSPPPRAAGPQFIWGPSLTRGGLPLARPVEPRSPSEHLVILSRMSRSFELDSKLSPRRRKRLLNLVAQLMAELQKELSS